MKWTKELPTEPGFYWWDNCWITTIVEVKRCGPSYTNKDLWATDNCEYDFKINAENCNDDRWAGPIPHPEGEA
jgi:hypothetical protein